MRLFIAIELPEQIKEHLANIQKQITNFKGKFVNNEQMHLTLKFLGETHENKLKEIKDALKAVKFDKINCFTTNIGFFPSENYIKVVWIGLEPFDKLVELQKQIDDSLKDIFPRDKRFHPHLTLARVRFIENKEKFKDNTKKIKLEKKEFIVDSFKLIKSTLTQKWPVYEEIENFQNL